ncbi:MAG: PDZ domain-containing protein [bacterium]|nr:PDZ domain-containing protein [candidate division KSB1 bacterium]MDH7560510.1 PDZ domain-containing protein [bacterium]
MKRWLWLPIALVALTLAQVAAAEKVVVVKTKGERRAWLGVYLQELDKERRKELGVKEGKGVLVIEVVPNSPADKAGLKEDDVIVRMNGREVEDPDDLIDAVRAQKPGDKVKVEYVREGKRREVEVTLGRPPRVTKRVVIPPLPPLERFWWDGGAWLGVELQALNASLAEYFAVKEDEGVLITEVEKNSPADKAGLLPGDVIVTIDGRQMQDIDAVADAISDKEEGDSVVVAYVRKGTRAETTVVLGKRPRIRVFGRGTPRLWWWERTPRRDYFLFPRERLWHFEFERPEVERWRERARDWAEKALDDVRRGLEKLRVEIKEQRRHMI